MQRRSSVRIAVSAGLATTLLLAGCAQDGESSSSPPSGGQDSKPFNLVLDTGITGPTAAVAKNILLGMQTAADQINASGGIGGRKIEITKLDDGGDPTKAVSELQNYLSSGKTPDVVYAGINSAETLALLPLLTQKKIVSISQTQSAPLNDPSKYPYHFGVSPTNLDRGTVYGPQMTKDGVKKLAALVPADAFGDDVANMLTTVTGKAGITLDVQKYDPKGLDYSSNYQRAMNNSPDAIFIEGTGDQSKTLFTARLKVGATNIRTYGGFGISSVPPATFAEPAALPNCQFPVYSYTVQGGISGSSADALKPLTEAVQKAGAAGGVFVPGLGYDGVRIIAKGAAGTNDAEALRKALEGLKLDPGYLVTQTAGFSYSTKSHFPGPPQGVDQTFVACGATIKDGFWVPQ
jgi:branched-chain amino acid transport system substrate-binding protein